MEELYESDVMWPDYNDRPIAPSNRFNASSSERPRAANSALSSTPVSIPAVSRPRSGEEQGNEDSELVPPHVLVSRSRMVGKVAFSLCSGQGRTLKGRDLRHVRDSVQRMTGFLDG